MSTVTIIVDGECEITITTKDKPVIREMQPLAKNFDHVILESRRDGEKVLQAMKETLAAYGRVLVSDLYDLTGCQSTYTDSQFGWTNLDRAMVMRQRSGYIIDLPRPTRL